MHPPCIVESQQQLNPAHITSGAARGEAFEPHFLRVFSGQEAFQGRKMHLAVVSGWWEALRVSRFPWPEPA
jgi:hypothetical protein